MNIKILADENIHYKIIEKLKSHGFTVISVLEEYSGISDKEVLKKCVQHDALLLTEDSDFGEWIFSYHKENCGVIFLRYQFQDLNNIIDRLIKILEDYQTELYNKFTVITTKKIRIRKI